MDKKILIVGGTVVIGIVAFMALKPDNNACQDICQKAKQNCPSLIDQTTCQKNCSKFSQETKDHLEKSKSCQELSQKPELIIDVIIPETTKPETQEAKGGDCQLSCANYTNKCLTLVPNADKNLFDQGMASCMSDCLKWDNKKIECMINAVDCQSMTEICGL